MLAVSFALYGLTKKKVGVSLDALHGLTVETVVLAPVAVVRSSSSARRATSTSATTAAGTLAARALGLVTAVPLLCFAAAARRIPLVIVGLIQFITPVMQLLCAVVLLDEHMPPERWIGFGIVWLALSCSRSTRSSACVAPGPRDATCRSTTARAEAPLAGAPR